MSTRNYLIGLGHCIVANGANFLVKFLKYYSLIFIWLKITNLIDWLILTGKRRLTVSAVSARFALHTWQRKVQSASESKRAKCRDRRLNRELTGQFERDRHWRTCSARLRTMRVTCSLPFVLTIPQLESTEFNLHNALSKSYPTLHAC